MISFLPHMENSDTGDGCTVLDLTESEQAPTAL